MRLQTLLFTPLLIGGMAVTGALAQGTSEPQSPATSTGNTASAHQPSDVIQSRIQQDLRSQNLNHVKVKVNDKKIVLNGNVSDESSRTNAVHIANSMAQGRKVVDHIEIGNNTNNQLSPPMSEQQPVRPGYGNGTGMNNPSQPMPPGSPRH